MKLNLHRPLSVVSASLLLVCCVVLTGCGTSAPPRFRQNTAEMDLKNVDEPNREAIATILEALYGTPDDPYVLPESGLDLKKIQLAAGPVRTGLELSGKGLYRQHCAHCHGTTGDGMGPTASILNPYPRDYRQGIFKFKSTERPDKPTNLDLDRVIRQGVVGTAMPSFDLLPGSEIDALVEYVKYLSIRGETEIKLIQAVEELGVGETLKLDREVAIDAGMAIVTTKWQSANDGIINPPERTEGELAASIARGRELFYGNVANCVKCHGPSAQGDGQTNDFDDWNKPVSLALKSIDSIRDTLKTDSSMSADDRKTRVDELSRLTAAVDASLPVRTIKPRNLRQGIFRGGPRPVDLYRRVYAGINGTPMPGLGKPGAGAPPPAAGAPAATVSPEDIWHIVDYVQSLPYEALSLPPHLQSLAKQGQM